MQNNYCDIKRLAILIDIAELQGYDCDCCEYESLGINGIAKPDESHIP